MAKRPRFKCRSPLLNGLDLFARRKHSAFDNPEEKCLHCQSTRLGMREEPCFDFRI